MCFFFVFLLLVHSHMRVYAAYRVHTTLDGEITGEGGRDNDVGPFLDRDVHDVPTFWDWLYHSFCSGWLKNDFLGFPYPGRVASYNQIIGGIQIRKFMTRPEKCPRTPGRPSSTTRASSGAARTACATWATR